MVEIVTSDPWEQINQATDCTVQYHSELSVTMWPGILSWHNTSIPGQEVKWPSPPAGVKALLNQHVVRAHQRPFLEWHPGSDALLWMNYSNIEGWRGTICDFEDIYDCRGLNRKKFYSFLFMCVWWWFYKIMFASYFCLLVGHPGFITLRFSGSTRMKEKPHETINQIEI